MPNDETDEPGRGDDAVAHWDSSAAFQSAIANPEFFSRMR